MPTRSRSGGRRSPARAHIFFARAGRAAAAVIGLYEGDDRFIFLLATRLPFRNRGIARWLLAYVIAEAYADGHR